MEGGSPWWKRFTASKLQVLLAGLGAVLLVVGAGGIFLSEKGSESPVEIISTDEGVSEKVIVVDVAGAVENPGVYELALGARVNDALTAAGGFKETADRMWIRRYVNLAQPVPDGAKVYVPAIGEANTVSSTGGSTGTTSSVSGATIGLGEVQGKININTASASELDSLWGIGEARSQAIIENRPYTNTQELVTKADIPQSVFDRIKDEIVAF